MAAAVHSSTPDVLPWFINAPGKIDVLMVAAGIFLVLFIFAVGLLYLRLHALPDRFAHNKVQLQIVCVLGLIAMFTHMHIFWIAGLLLAMIDLPDFLTPIKRIAGSVARISNNRISSSNAPNIGSRTNVEREDRGAPPRMQSPQ